LVPISTLIPTRGFVFFNVCRRKPEQNTERRYGCLVPDHYLHTMNISSQSIQRSITSAADSVPLRSLRIDY
jgi:hypothetical protein